MAKQAAGKELGYEDIHDAYEDHDLQSAGQSQLKGPSALGDFLNHINLYGEEVRLSSINLDTSDVFLLQLADLQTEILHLLAA